MPVSGEAFKSKTYKLFRWLRNKQPLLMCSLRWTKPGYNLPRCHSDTGARKPRMDPRVAKWTSFSQPGLQESDVPILLSTGSRHTSLSFLFFFFYFLAILYSMWGLFFFNWHIIALEYCVSFCCTAKWISHMYTYIPSLSDLPRSPPSHPIRSSQSTELSSLCSFLLAIYFTHGSVYMSILIS